MVIFKVVLRYLATLVFFVAIASKCSHDSLHFAWRNHASTSAQSNRFYHAIYNELVFILWYYLVRNIDNAPIAPRE